MAYDLSSPPPALGKEKPEPRCKRLPVDCTKEERLLVHGLRMKRKARARANGIPTGFTPVPNGRINRAIGSVMSRRALENAIRQGRGLPIVPFTEHDAVQEVAATLPAPRRSKVESIHRGLAKAARRAERAAAEARS